MDKKKILVVDDEASITKLIKFALERSGRFEVVCENSGANALSAARSFRPDLIILDINLPDVPGGEISAQLLDEPDLRRVPIIFLTGMLSQDESKSGVTIGGHVAMSKPIQIEKLIECIDKNIHG